MTQIRGREILADTKQRGRIFTSSFTGKRITIIRFEPPPTIDEVGWGKYEAARYSTEAKEKTFRSIGCEVEQVLRSEVAS